MTPLLVHLRLPFQIALSVIFLWGVFCSRGGYDLGTLLAYLAFTVCSSGGATAFNSCYDRDRGPVGGLRRPPPVSGSLLPFSVGVMAAGLPLAIAGGGMKVGGAYLLAAILFVLYSLPPVRFKSKPWRSMAVVSVCSGWICFEAGVESARGADPGWPATAGGLASLLFIAGFYPLTQVGQMDEDRERGDRTFALVYGRNASFRWSLLVVALAGALNIACAAALAGAGAAAGLGLAMAALGFQVLRWRRDPDLDAGPIADVLAYGSAAAHLAVIVYSALRS